MTTEHAWGDVEVGDHVTSFGRHGAGQPPIEGRVERIKNGTCTVRLKNREKRIRYISNLRRPGLQ